MKIRKQDKAEYQRLKNNIKSKIRRVQKQHNLDLSGLIELPPLDSFTRKDFNLWKEQAKKFTSRANKVKHNEYGVPYTNQLVKEYQKRADEANKIKDKLNEIFDKKAFTRDGKPTGLTVKQFDFLMKDADELGTKTRRKFDIHEIKDLRGLEKTRKRIDEERDINTYVNDMSEFQKNWIEGIERVFNNAADSLVNKVKVLDPAVFYEMYKATGEMHFEEWYPDKTMEEAGQFEELMQSAIDNVEKHFDQNFRNKEVMLLKDFPDKW